MALSDADLGLQGGRKHITRIIHAESFAIDPGGARRRAPLSRPLRLEMDAASPAACNHAEERAAPCGLAEGQAELRHADCSSAGRPAAVHVQPGRLEPTQSPERGCLPGALARVRTRC
jgi:hypothetical protein